MEKPTMKQRFDGFLTFIWNSEKGTVLGRGGKSWAEIGLFYLIYYICLASFFAATLAVFYQTMDTDKPKLQGDSSLLDGNPGLGFRPRPEHDKVSVVAKAKGKNEANRKNMKEFLKKYRNPDLKNVDCPLEENTRPGQSTPCKMDLTEFDNRCPESQDYGFGEGKPCVAIKMNKVFGWEPKLWTTSEMASSNYPQEIKDIYDPKFVPLRCYAKDKKDREHLGTPEYIPQQGYPVVFYPWEGQEDYMAPLVFVKFGGNMTEDKTIKVVCRTYAKNVNFDLTETAGSVQFEVEV